MQRTSSLAFGWLATGLATLAIAGTASAQWDPNYGTLLSQADDALITNLALNHAFPLPGGGTTNAVSVSTNGWVKLTGAPASTSSQLVASVSDLLADEPRIAALWDDLTGTASGGVQGAGLFFNALTTKTVITWRTREFGTTRLIDVQLQMYPDGRFSLQYARGATNDGLVGVSPGGGAADPGGTNLSAGVTGGGSTVYELFGAGAMDLNNSILLWSPNSGGGYDVVAGPAIGPFATATAYGAGCPAAGGGSIHEFFAGSGSADAFDLPAGSSIAYTYLGGTGYGVAAGPANQFDPNIGTQVAWNGGGTGDDSLSTQTLPFAFPLPDGTTTTSIDIDSNGCVWLVSGLAFSDFTPSPTDFTSASNPGRIAALWTDFNNNPASTTGGGTVAFTASATKATITWDQVPTFGNDPLNPANLSTVQVQMFPNGNFFVVYQSVGLGTLGIVGDQALIGYTIGFNSVSLPEIDHTTGLPAVMPFAESVPMTHDCDVPVLGSTPSARAGSVPTGTLAAVLHIGLDQTNLPLDPIGMPGCVAYTLAIVAVLPMNLGMNNDADVSLGLIPNTPSLVGGPYYTQAIALVPMINPLQLIASNGVVSRMGL